MQPCPFFGARHGPPPPRLDLRQRRPEEVAAVRGCAAGAGVAPESPSSGRRRGGDPWSIYPNRLFCILSSYCLSQGSGRRGDKTQV